MKKLNNFLGFDNDFKYMFFPVGKGCVKVRRQICRIQMNRVIAPFNKNTLQYCRGNEF